MILLIDNRDSYTFNLFQLIAEVAGVAPLVVPADDVFADGIPARVRGGEFSHVVISPGPGTPAADGDFAGSRAVLEAAGGTPVLGVCLGHQGLGMLAGATVDRAPRARHGFVSRIAHSGAGLFHGIPQDFGAVRYHSLHLRDVDEATVRIHARAEDGIIMGIEVRGRPHWGVQFHPESVLTEHGAALMRNFLALAPVSGRGADALTSPRAVGSRPVLHEAVDIALDCAATFARLQGGTSAAFWLDSAAHTRDSGRYSVLGTNAGSLAQTVRYRVGGQTEVRSGETVERLDVDILTYLDEQLSARSAPELGIPFTGGFVGYLGYECKALTVGSGKHRSDQPDAYWLRPQAFIVYDHDLERAHLVVEMANDATDLLAELRRSLCAVREQQHHGALAGPRAPKGSWRLTRAAYEARITEIKAALLRGDSYEVCLTDTFETEARLDGFTLYCELRRDSPAPYAAYFRFETFGDDLEIVSASPERFLRVDRDGTVESKPIKGTSARATDPAEDHSLAQGLQRDPKTRAENLMIVDLLRNDLGRVCEIGSVHVPSLMQIETYATVHQLVSTVRGTLRSDATLVSLLHATFPGGSMTGAPKARTLAIIDDLEPGPRGIYSGALGYLGFDGSADLSIVIRTIVKSGDRLQIGAGGAIVLDSDPAAEVAEKELKARALRQAISRVKGHSDGH